MAFVYVKLGNFSKMPIRSRPSAMDKYLEVFCVFLLFSLRLLIHLSFIVRTNPRT